MDATAGLLLLQVPPGVASLSADINPAQISVVPVIAIGTPLTVSVIVVLHPGATVKVPLFVTVPFVVK